MANTSFDMPKPIVPPPRLEPFSDRQFKKARRPAGRRRRYGSNEGLHPFDAGSVELCSLQ
jgi:hypothetical protein